MRGLYIAVEGIDGAGTTTHAKLLARTLTRAGHPAVYVQEPSPGPIGRLIRSMLGRGVYDQEVYALLFAADRLLQYRRRTSKLLEEGLCIVSCRSIVSSLAYQTLDGPALTEWIMTVNRYAPLPDIVVYLDVPLGEALRRLAARSRRDVFEKPALLRELLARYREVLALLRRLGVVVVVVEEVEEGRVRDALSVHREAAVKTLAAIKYIQAVKS